MSPSLHHHQEPLQQLHAMPNAISSMAKLLAQDILCAAEMAVAAVSHHGDEHAMVPHSSQQGSMSLLAASSPLLPATTGPHARLGRPGSAGRAAQAAQAAQHRQAPAWEQGSQQPGGDVSRDELNH
jgi:hypothetical protein